VPEELVGAEVPDVDIDQLAAAAIDGVAAHLLEVVRVLGLGMWTARHIDGSLQRLCHCEHTICALVRISNASSLIRIEAVTSRGRASQLRNSSGGGSIARFSVQGVSEMGNGVRRRKKDSKKKKRNAE